MTGIFEQVILGIKIKTDILGLDYDTLEELLADLKRIDVQLTSSRPKTKILRECFQSIIDVLQKVHADELVNQAKGLILLHGRPGTNKPSGGVAICRLIKNFCRIHARGSPCKIQGRCHRRTDKGIAFNLASSGDKAD